MWKHITPILLDWLKEPRTKETYEHAGKEANQPKQAQVLMFVGLGSMMDPCLP